MLSNTQNRNERAGHVGLRYICRFECFMDMIAVQVVLPEIIPRWAHKIAEIRPGQGYSRKRAALSQHQSGLPADPSGQIYTY